MAENVKWLARFIFTRDHIRNDGSVKKGAFMVKRPTPHSSVDIHDNFAEDIHWDGAKAINSSAPLIGAAEVEESFVTALGFTVKKSATQENRHHGEICGWDRCDADNEKMFRIEMASELADASRFVCFCDTTVP